MSEIIIKGVGNPAKIKVTSTEYPNGIDFVTNGVTSMVLTFGNFSVNSSSGLLTYADAGEITFNLGTWATTNNVPVGVYTGFITAFDAGNPDGIQIVAPCVGSRLLIKVVDAN